MPEHAHLTALRRVKGDFFTVRTVVRRRFAEAEARLAEDLGYSTQIRYCGDPTCLGPEPAGEWRGEGSG